MVDSNTYEKLTNEEKAVYGKYSSEFIRAVLNSAANDGFQFLEIYEVREVDGN